MKNSILLISLMSSTLLFSCSAKEEKKEGNDREADVKKMCECFEASKNDSQKFMECSEENGKIREKYKDNNDELTKYDEELAKCM